VCMNKWWSNSNHSTLKVMGHNFPEPSIWWDYWGTGLSEFMFKHISFSYKGNVWIRNIYIYNRCEPNGIISLIDLYILLMEFNVKKLNNIWSNCIFGVISQIAHWAEEAFKL
jgi:hypothetical protein